MAWFWKLLALDRKCFISWVLEITELVVVRNHSLRFALVYFMLSADEILS